MESLGNYSIADYDAYAVWTDTTAQYPVTAEPHYLGLGIVDEFGEFCEKAGGNSMVSAIVKEAGDVCWYAARYATRVLGLSFGELLHTAAEPRYSLSAGTFRRTELVFGDAVIHCGVICGIEKKRIRDGASWSKEVTAHKHEGARNALLHLLGILHSYARHYGFTLAEACARNQGKLTERKEAGTIRGDGDNR